MTDCDVVIGKSIFEASKYVDQPRLEQDQPGVAGVTKADPVVPSVRVHHWCFALVRRSVF